MSLIGKTLKLIVTFTLFMNETISEASPIHFWPIGDPTFNEEIAPFIIHKPYIHEWQCDDPIKLQVGNEQQITNSYFLKIKDKNGNVTNVLPYVKTLITGKSVSLDFLNTTFPSVLTPWVNYNAGSGQVNFSWTSANLITADGTSGSLRQTSNLYQPRPDGYFMGWPPGNYQISLNGFNASTGPDASTMQAIALVSNDGLSWTTLGTSSSIPSGAFGFNLAFTIPAGTYYQFIAYQFNIGPPGNIIIVRLNDTHLNAAPASDTYAEYDLTFNASSLDVPICGTCARFYISSAAGTLDEETLDSDTLDTISDADDLYKSDLHKFSPSVTQNQSWGSRLIYYKAPVNFAGINYPNDGNYFALRVASKFYFPRNQKSQTSLPLSQSKIVTTSIVNIKQRLFETVFMPPYMLNKLELIFQHCVGDGTVDGSGSVKIDKIEWQADESFDRGSPDVKFAFQDAKTWLSEGVVRNII